MHVVRQSEAWLLEHILSNQRTLNLKLAHNGSIHVAILMKRGKIIAEATNNFGSRRLGSGYSDKTIHAERNVIKEIGNIQNIRGAEMYVVRISRNDCNGPDPFCSSKPCYGCHLFLEKCMKEYGLKNVYYT